MTRKQWIEKAGHSAETTKAKSGETSVTIIDDKGRIAQAWGKSEDVAFTEAHTSYKAANHRAGLSLANVAGRFVKPVD